MKKEISIDKGDLYLVKMAFTLLLILGPFSLNFFISEVVKDYKNVVFIVIFVLIWIYIFRFVWFAKYIIMDNSYFHIMGLFKIFSLPIESAVKAESTFLMNFQQIPQIKLRFAVPGKKNKLVILVPNRKAFKTKRIVNELQEMIDEKRGTLKQPAN